MKKMNKTKGTIDPKLAKDHELQFSRKTSIKVLSH